MLGDGRLVSHARSLDLGLVDQSDLRADSFGQGFGQAMNVEAGYERRSSRWTSKQAMNVEAGDGRRSRR